MLEDRRREGRRLQKAPLDFMTVVVEYGQLQKREAHGRVIETSRSGIRLETDFPLENGQVLLLRPWGETDRPSVGQVRWVAPWDHSVTAGVRISPHVVEDLPAFSGRGEA
jgi:hypothetical protein